MVLVIKVAKGHKGLKVQKVVLARKVAKDPKDLLVQVRPDQKDLMVIVQLDQKVVLVTREV